MIRGMPHRTIPIIPVPREMSLQEPTLVGQRDQLETLLAGLDLLAREELGPAVPRGAWLRSLRIQADTAELDVAPRLGGCGPAFMQAAFELLRSRLCDTDIYVGRAER